MHKRDQDHLPGIGPRMHARRRRDDAFHGCRTLGAFAHVRSACVHGAARSVGSGRSLVAALRRHAAIALLTRRRRQACFGADFGGGCPFRRIRPQTAASQEETRVRHLVLVGQPRPQTQDGHRPAQTVGHGQRVLARRRLEPVLRLRIVARRQGLARVFQVDHPRDELAVQRQLQVVLGNVDGDGEAALLIGRRVEPVDDLDGGKDFQPFGQRDVRHAEPIDGADEQAGLSRGRLRLGRSGCPRPARSRPRAGP